MKFWQKLQGMFSLSTSRIEVPGAPQSLQEFEKSYVRKAQEEMRRTLQILEIEAELAERK